MLGIYCIIQVIPTLVELSSIVVVERTVEHSDFPILTAFLQASIPSVGWLVTAILLLMFSVPWGKKLAVGIGGEKIAGVSFEQAQVLAFAAVGAWLAAEGLSELCGSIYSTATSVGHFNPDQFPGGPQYIDWRQIFRTFGEFVQTAIGLWMFFGAHGFANLWRSMRGFGTPKPPGH